MTKTQKVKIKVKSEAHCAEIQEQFRKLGCDLAHHAYKNKNFRLDSEFIYADFNEGELYVEVGEPEEYYETTLEVIKAIAPTGNLPIGLVPRSIIRKQRVVDIIKAISRYVIADAPVPVEWVDELSELLYGDEHV